MLSCGICLSLPDVLHLVYNLCVYPCCCIWHYFILFYGWVIFHRVCRPYLYPLIVHSSTICNNQDMEATCVHQEMSLISIYIMARSGEATPEGGSVEKRREKPGALRMRPIPPRLCRSCPSPSGSVFPSSHSSFAFLSLFKSLVSQYFWAKVWNERVKGASWGAEMSR